MFKRRFVSILTLSLSLSLLTAVPSMAANSKTPTSGSAQISNSQVTPFTVVNAGGGTWDYGSDYYQDGTKDSYSLYVHPTSKHHTTAIIADSVATSSVENAGIWAKAYAYGGKWLDKAYAYWSLD